MYRKVIEDLREWKKRQNRKPLIIQGARQSGKTWLMQEFGRLEFKHTVMVNFEDDPNARELFEYDLDVNRIINTLSIQAGFPIDAETLLIFAKSCRISQFWRQAAS